MQSDAHSQKFTHLFKYIPFVSSASKWSKVVDMVSAKVHADNKLGIAACLTQHRKRRMSVFLPLEPYVSM